MPGDASVDVAAQGDAETMVGIAEVHFQYRLDLPEVVPHGVVMEVEPVGA
ncbi:hypothetical protein SDC9_209256 [bioreactor metagenome]|uniref:Uncharacterized protein n=1 Tax=bioreactor metagenome TaxID=1076179 RepID=A0A645JCU7_9ZZZZ